MYIPKSTFETITEHQDKRFWHLGMTSSSKSTTRHIYSNVLFGRHLKEESFFFHPTINVNTWSFIDTAKTLTLHWQMRLHKIIKAGDTCGFVHTFLIYFNTNFDLFHIFSVSLKVDYVAFNQLNAAPASSLWCKVYFHVLTITFHLIFYF